MNLLTTDTLHDLGVHKSKAEEAAIIEHFQQTLNERVGLTILDVLSDDQATRLMDLTDAGDQEQITAWLQETLPEYTEIAQNEYDILMGELADSADEL